jgi:hypothetical protein
MKSALYSSIAAALTGGPIGWFAGGFFAAQRMQPHELILTATLILPRPIYLSGLYYVEAVAGAALAVALTVLLRAASRAN